MVKCLDNKSVPDACAPKKREHGSYVFRLAISCKSSGFIGRYFIIITNAFHPRFWDTWNAGGIWGTRFV